MHRLEICVSSWPTHIFKAIKIVDGYLAQQRNKIGKVQNATLCLPNHIPVCNAHWFKCHYRQLYFKADRSEIHFLCKLSLPFYTFVFTSAENMSLLPGLHVRRSTQKQSLMKILSLREREKAAEKDPSATVVASVCSTGVTVVGSTNAAEFWQRWTPPPSFSLLLSRRMDLAIPQWSWQPNDLLYLPFLWQLLLYLLPALICCMPVEKTWTKLRLFHGCSDKSWWRKQNKELLQKR